MSMVESQILNKVLSSKDPTILIDNCLENDYFPSYKDEFDFIIHHFKNYGQIPDKTTFLSNFPNFELYEVSENDNYLIDYSLAK